MDTNITDAFGNGTTGLATVALSAPSCGNGIGIEAGIRILLYAIIFVCAVIGNSLVILTLVQKRRMRTVTNVFLLNLAVSDLLLGVFCMPVTLLGSVLRNFVLGGFMCKLIPYLQGKRSLLRAMIWPPLSIERLYSRLRKGRSLNGWYATSNNSWQCTLKVSVFSLSCKLPIHLRRALRNGASRRICTNGMRGPINRSPTRSNGGNSGHVTRVLNGNQRWDSPSPYPPHLPSFPPLLPSLPPPACNPSPPHTPDLHPLDFHALPSLNDPCPARPSTSHSEETVARVREIIRAHRRLTIRERRVIRMLAVLVLEFFVCWMPLYVLHTWTVFDAQSAYSHVSADAIAAVHLLAYVSSCCNPITYCFMHDKYRQAFRNVLGC
ncbi:unnamed protein product, partial [Ixodes hexagonus]